MVYSLHHNHQLYLQFIHDDIIKWKYFPRYWPFVWGIHRSPVNSPHKGQRCRVLMFSLIYAWINGWVKNREAGDLRRHHVHYDVTVRLVNGQQACLTNHMLWPAYNARKRLDYVPLVVIAYCLTHLPLGKMAAILADDNLKCIFLNKNDRLLKEFNWNLFRRAQLTIS